MKLPYTSQEQEAMLRHIYLFPRAREPRDSTDEIFIPAELSGGIDWVAGLNGTFYNVATGLGGPGHWRFDQIFFSRVQIADPVEQLKRAPTDSPLAKALQGRTPVEWSKYPTRTVYDLVSPERVELHEKGLYDGQG